MTSPFVGSGWGFPIRTDAAGGIALVSREREIEEAMMLVLATAYGERPMRPEYGCRIHDFVFAPADANTAGLIAFEVKASLRRWEPRIEVTDVDVSFDAENPALLYIDVSYRIAETNDERNLVFPFYTIPDHEES